MILSLHCVTHSDMSFWYCVFFLVLKKKFLVQWDYSAKFYSYSAIFLFLLKIKAVQLLFVLYKQLDIQGWRMHVRNFPDIHFLFDFAAFY